MTPTTEELNIAKGIATDLVNLGLNNAVKCKLVPKMWDPTDFYYKSNYIGWTHNNHVKAFLEASDIEVASGATKLVFICAALPNWVLKVNFERPVDKYGWSVEDSINFCKKEADFYAEAEAEGIDEFFAATFLLGTFKGCQIYIQETAMSNYDAIDSMCYDMIANDYEAWSNEEDEDDRNYNISCAVDDLTDEERLDIVFSDKKGSLRSKLFSFIDERKINDIHSGNIGYNKTGYKIIDYSGYCS